MPYFLRSQAKECRSGSNNLSSTQQIFPIAPVQGLKTSFPALLEEAFAQQDERFEEGDKEPPKISDPALSTLPPPSPEIASMRYRALPAWIEQDLSNLMAQDPQTGRSKALSRSHTRRKRKRNLEILENGQTPRPAAKKALLDRCSPVPTSLSTESLPTTSCGYQARHIPKSLQLHTENENLGKLLQEGYRYIEWNGSDPRPILDDQRRVIGVLAGKPNSERFNLACNRIFERVLSLGELPEMQQMAKTNRRGDFPALNFGVTHGKGTASPVNLHGPQKGKPSPYASIVEALLHDDDLRMLATFGSYSFATWAPNVYEYYRRNLSHLWEKEPHLRRSFPKSVFPSAALNAGPCVWTNRHKDSMNCAFGMCSIHALGKFDHKQGGHLVLPDLELIIEFPANSTILIPSATLIHANIPILPGEQRCSFTQYCAGGLFRYIDSHFMTEKKLKAVDPIAYDKVQALKTSRWKMGLGLLSTFEDLVEEVKDI